MTDAEHKTAIADSRRDLAAFALYKSTGTGAWIEVVGRSMSPLISAGDELYVEFGPRRPHLGEIVVFPEGQKMIVHRLVRRSRAGAAEVFVTRGDGMPYFDAPFEADQVFGVVGACRRSTDGSLVPIAARGLQARTVACVSAGAGFALLGVERLPAPLRSFLGRAGRRVAPAVVARVARACAWSERLSSGPQVPAGSWTAPSRLSGPGT